MPITPLQLMRIRPGSGPVAWKFRDPDTGHLYEAKDRNSLINQIGNYRAQNELAPLQEPGLVIENYLANLPENRANAEPTPPLRRGLVAYLKGGIALLDMIYYGEKAMVAPNVAESRAGICVKCPMNQFPDRSAFIQWADSMAEAATGGKRVPQYDSLGNCNACSCNLRSKIWYKGPFNPSAEERSKMPDYCWQIHEYNKGNR